MRNDYSSITRIKESQGGINISTLYLSLFTSLTIFHVFNYWSLMTTLNRRNKGDMWKDIYNQ